MRIKPKESFSIVLCISNISIALSIVTMADRKFALKQHQLVEEKYRQLVPVVLNRCRYAPQLKKLALPMEYQMMGAPLRRSYFHGKWEKYHFSCLRCGLDLKNKV